MGIYLYSVRTTKSIKCEIEGETETVFALAYLCKPSYTWGTAYSESALKRVRLASRLASRCQGIWANRTAPKFVYFSDGPVDGAPVWEWDGRCMDYDTPDFGGKKRVVGFLKRTKVGRKTVWSVMPKTVQVY